MNIGPVAELALGPDELGESICWDPRDGSLLRVDVLAGLVHSTTEPLTADLQTTTMHFQGEVGFVLPRRDGGVVVGAERTIWIVEPDGSRQALIELDDRPANRWNDAICDSQGRLWAGTMARDRRQAAASLYRVDPDGANEVVLPGLTISNGLAWAESGSRLHFVDSPTQRIDILEIDLDVGRIEERRALAAIDPENGMPDGLCVDSEGGTWVALLGGARLLRVDGTGVETAELPLPVRDPTNVCLGGPSGQEMLITTARHRLSARERRVMPIAGRVLHARSDVTATPMFAFAG